jgi:hypothetical protein
MSLRGRDQLRVHCAQCALGQRKRLGIKRVTSGAANHAESSACFACIVFFICAKILSCFAAHRVCIGDRGPTPLPLPRTAARSGQSVGSSCWVPDHLIGAARFVLAAARLTHCTEHNHAPMLDIILDLFSYPCYASRLNFQPLGDRARVHCRPRPHRRTGQAALRHPAAGLA